ncbi:MAG: hypothetical protein ACOYOV_00050 [Bacteroidales bacterium]
MNDKDLMSAPTHEEMDSLMAAPTAEELGQVSTPSKLESFGRGAAQGATFGLADELTSAVQNPVGAAEQIANLLGAGISNPDVEAYKKERDISRANYQAAEEANPLTSMAGNITGGIGQAVAAAPLAGLNVLKGLVGGGEALSAGQKLLQAGKLGAGLGAANAIGTSTANTGMGLAKETGLGAVTGGIGGAALSGVGQVAGKAMSGAKNLAEDYGIGKKILSTFKLAKEEGFNPFTTSGLHEAEAKSTQAAEGVRKQMLDTTSELAQAKSAILDKAEKAGVRVNATDDINNLYQVASELGSDPLQGSDKSILQKLAASIMEDQGLVGTTELSPAQADKIRKMASNYTVAGDNSLKTPEARKAILDFTNSLNTKIREKITPKIANSVDNPMIQNIVKSNPDIMPMDAVDKALSTMLTSQDVLGQSRGSVAEGIGQTEALRKIMARMEAETSGGTAAREQLNKVGELLGNVKPELKEGLLKQAKTASERLELSRAGHGLGGGGMVGKGATMLGQAVATGAGKAVGTAENIINNANNMIQKATQIHGADSFITKALQKVNDTVDDSKKRAMVNTLMQTPYYRQKIKALEEPEDGSEIK